jgi:uncharacterized protein YecT (DUF1311 family)
MTSCCASTRALPISSTRAANSGATRATAPGRWRISARAIKLNPQHSAARGNYKSLAQELERIGALMAVAGKPSFNCNTARRAVEKAICANPELADLDREIHAINVRIIGEARSPAEAHALQREQNAFIARRDAGFGRPGYDLRKAMKERLQKLVGVDGY